MHNNEFEKRMEHKLEELKFTPSDAVWQKVEVQIRECKRRRRFFFWWLPAIVLCTGVGAWFLYSIEKGNTNASTTVTTTQKTESSLSIENNQNKQTETVPEGKPVAEEKNMQTVIEKSSRQEQDAVVVKTKKDAPVADGLIVKKNKKTAGKQNDQLVVTKEKPIAPAIKNPDAVNHGEVNVPLPEEKKNPVVSVTKENEQIKTEKPVITEKVIAEEKPVAEAKSDESVKPVVTTPATVTEKTSVTDSTANNSVKQMLAAGKPVITDKKRFEIALVFRGGVADMSQFTESSNKNGRFYASPGSGQVGSGYSSSPSDSAKVKNGVGFTAGVQLKKSIARRSALSIGLGYGYYSSSHKTSSVVYADAQFSNSLGTSVVNNYARVGNNVTYKDRYHFIEIPVLYHLQVTKAAKRPVLFNGGVAYSYLAGSNAQYYYSATKTYYYDRSLFSRSQLQLRTGISFGLGKKMNYPLQLGLQYQYGLSGQWKKSLDLNQHLSFTGIQLSWRLNKK